MRTILNLSLPQELALVVDSAVDSGNYASKSEFFRDLLRNWMENRLLGSLKTSQKELTKGKGKLLKSLKDLRYG
ncbi:MAG: ribbon-helix-helix domain-containing protein [Patescibacteria group bacterium]